MLKDLTAARHNLTWATMAVKPKGPMKREVHHEVSRVAHELADLSASLLYILSMSGITPPDPAEVAKNAADKAIRKHHLR